MTERLPLKPLHPDSSLSTAKLAIFDRFTTERLIESLAPAQEHSLKTNPHGIMLDGHHRIHILRNREVDVDSLPREIITQKEDW
jgi:hypothetical protein